MAGSNSCQKLIETFRRWQEVEYFLRYLTDDENKHLAMRRG